MRFEKWQALGNDYLIVTEPVDPETVRALCHRHLGVGADGVLLVERTDEPGFVASLRIFNPDGSEAELSGNGAREALMWLHHRGWAPGRQFSITTVAGEIRATVLDERSCRPSSVLALVLERELDLGSVGGDRTIVDHHVELGDLGDAHVAQGLRRFGNCCRGCFLPALGAGPD